MTSDNRGLVSRRNSELLAQNPASSDYRPNIIGKAAPEVELAFRIMQEKQEAQSRRMDNLEKSIPQPAAPDDSKNIHFVELFVGNVRFRSGVGTPEGVLVGSAGKDVYFREDGGVSTCLYLKETGENRTGWQAK
jgi:hypothetical protein